MFISSVMNTKLIEAQLGMEIKELWLKGLDFLRTDLNRLINDSWKKVFQSWIKLTFIKKNHLTSNTMLCEHLWNNPKITINNSSLI